MQAGLQHHQGLLQILHHGTGRPLYHRAAAFHYCHCWKCTDFFMVSFCFISFFPPSVHATSSCPLQLRVRMSIMTRPQRNACYVWMLEGVSSLQTGAGVLSSVIFCREKSSHEVHLFISIHTEYSICMYFWIFCTVVYSGIDDTSLLNVNHSELIPIHRGGSLGDTTGINHR